jgi:hypothetical protein
MLELPRLLVQVGTTASWIVFFIATIVAVFVVYIGIAMGATLRASDPEQQKMRYRIFHGKHILGRGAACQLNRRTRPRRSWRARR